MAEVNTVVVLGDSGSMGFGTGGRSFPVVLAETLGAARLEVSADFGRTTADMLDEHAAVLAGLAPDMIVLQSGMADSLMHPGRRVQRLLEHFAPKTWHGVDGLERRAVYSGSRTKRARQSVTSFAKTTLKRSLVALTGGFTRMQPDSYGACLDQLLDRLEATGAIVVTINIWTIDERIFPRQARSAQPFLDVRSGVLARHPAVVDVDIDPVLHRWDDFLADHGHFNADGHAAVAAEIVRRTAAARLSLSPAGQTPASA